MNAKFVLRLFVLIFLLISFSGGISLFSQGFLLEKADREWLSLHSEIRVGIHEYPPLVFKNSSKDKYDGISIQYLQLIENLLGVKFKLIPYPAWTDVLTASERKEVDVIFAIQKTPERESFLNFTSPYLSITNMIISRKGINRYSIDDLIGKKVAVVENSALHKYLTQNYPGINLIPVKEEVNALIMVSAYEADASIAEISRISYYFQKELFTNLTIAGPIDFKYEFRFGIRKDYLVLSEMMNKALLSIPDSTGDAIVKNWIDIEEKSIFEEWIFWQVLGGFAGFLILVSILYWNRTLNKLIQYRTRLLNEALIKAESSSRSKSEFLSSMSHELRTPLNAILGFAQLLKSDSDDPLSETQKESLDYIINSGWHLLAMINEVLQLSRIESGKVVLCMETVNPLTIIHDCLIKVAVHAEKENISIINEIQDSDGYSILADKLHLKQVLLDLLTNAIKYNRPNGSVIIRVVKRDDNFTEISVTDTGLGMSGEELETLFEPFTRFGDTSSVQGTGIGLTISKKLVEAMGGSLEVKSAPNEGSTFTIVIRNSLNTAV